MFVQRVRSRHWHCAQYAANRPGRLPPGVGDYRMIRINRLLQKASDPLESAAAAFVTSAETRFKAAMDRRLRAL